MSHSKWSELPELVLVVIFSYLPGKDRFNAGQVCSHWYNSGFKDPSFWRQKDIEFSKDKERNVRNLKFAQGWSCSFLKRLTVMVDKSPVPCLTDFFKALSSSGGPQLEFLSLTVRIPKTDPALRDAVSTFLKGQKTLRSLKLQQCCFLPASVGLRILKNAVAYCTGSIEDLKLNNFFDEPLNHSEVEELSGTIYSLEKLNTLALDGFWTTHSVLEALFAKRGESLPSFEQLLIGSWSDFAALIPKPVLRREWQMLRRLFKTVRVICFEIRYCDDLSDLYALPDFVSVHMIKGSFTFEGSDFSNFLNYLVQHCGNTLGSLSLQMPVRGADPWTDEVISQFGKLPELSDLLLPFNPEDALKVLSKLSWHQLPKLTTMDIFLYSETSSEEEAVVSKVQSLAPEIGVDFEIFGFDTHTIPSNPDK